MENRINLQELNAAVQKIKNEIGKVIVGQQEMIELLITAILAQGHVLIEGVPGVAKTLTAKLLSKCIDVPFSRIQFTPDLMPGDVLGTTIFNPKEAVFTFKKGPIFSNIVLIDEINRSPAKTQAALFEVMEERQVTYDGYTHVMPEPFIVLATQNPIEQEGTYRLPEAQLDRFLFKISVTYPTPEEEVLILQNAHQGLTSHIENVVTAVLSAQDVIQYSELVKEVHIEDKVLKFIAAIVSATRTSSALYLGASPRASVAILNSSKALAAVRGKDFVTPDDVIQIVPAVLAHRIILTPEKEMESATPLSVINDLLHNIEVPR